MKEKRKSTVINKTKKKIIEDWIIHHGAANFDLKKRDIILPDGGLFSIEKEKYKARKIIGHKKLPNGNVEILFSKKKLIPSERYKATFWFQELDETISYFKRMKKMLNKLGYKTNRGAKH